MTTDTFVYRRKFLPDHCTKLIDSKEQEGYKLVDIKVEATDPDKAIVHFKNLVGEDAYYTLEKQE